MPRLVTRPPTASRADGALDGAGRVGPAGGRAVTDVDDVRSTTRVAERREAALDREGESDAPSGVSCSKKRRYLTRGLRAGQAQLTRHLAARAVASQHGDAIRRL
jgi:hypothetical protein